MVDSVPMPAGMVESSGLRNALLSCHDRQGLIELAKALIVADYRLYASDGTARYLQENGIAVTALTDSLQLTPKLNGRLKTLDSKVFAGLLANLDITSDRHYLQENRLNFFAILVVNFYPFTRPSSTVVSLEQQIELIDVGGPAMIRAASKNWQHVIAVSSPSDYPALIKELSKDSKDRFAASYRLQAAAKNFQLLSKYDANIASWLQQQQDQSESSTEKSTAHLPLPQQIEMSASMVLPLRYGENPHQAAAVYSNNDQFTRWCRQLDNNTTTPSFNNLRDAAAAWQCVEDLPQSACAIIKHNNPCGVVVAASCKQAWLLARRADPVSAFGGVVACNCEIDAETARAITTTFVEVIVAPAFANTARQILASKPRIRLMTPPPMPQQIYDVYSYATGFLLQQRDILTGVDQDWTLATPALADKITDKIKRDLIFAWQIAGKVGSNAIVIAAAQQTLGIGGGFTNRVDATKYAIDQAIKFAPEQLKAANPVVASDAFFPFVDSLELLKQFNISAVVYPQGGKRQAELVEYAENNNIGLWLATKRHFRH